MRWLVVMALAVAGVAAPATAAEAPERGAPAEWVDRVAIPAPDPALKDKPVQTLLVSVQSRYGKDEQPEHYVETAVLAQSPQGVQAIGTVAIPWHPDSSRIIVHKVEIVRNGKGRDVLADGQEFTVLRRENNLESAMLDGILTAVIQPEGLMVGDVINVAWTARDKKGAIPFRPENFYFFPPGLAARKARYREIWDEGVPIRWRGTGVMADPRIRKTGGTTELLVELKDVQMQAPPEGAPPRFLFPARLELSGYGSWREISALFAPAYESARRLPPSSPLAAEAEKIARATKDPGERAMAALRLVQDRIRYLALAMGDGGYVPASAEQTWARKFGDCKGKTATLLALLAGLGIEAEPVLVSNGFGDSLGETLPLVRLFDHVIVRAVIDGRAYWLDGTRRGDRNLHELASSPFGHALPVRAAGADLERLPLAPPREPISSYEVTYDASAGFHQLVPVSGSMTFTGDLAALWRQALAEQGEAEMRKSLLEQNPVGEVEKLEITALSADDDSGRFSYSFSGKTRMRWEKTPGKRGLRFAFEKDTLEWEPDFEREIAAHRDVPFALTFPMDLAARQTIVLPRGGAGFTVDGKPVEETLAGTSFSRKLSLEGGKVTATSRFRRLAPEIDAAAARAAIPRIKEISESRAYVVAPDSYEISDVEARAIRKDVPTSAGDHNVRGFQLMRIGRVKEALADFDRAAALAPHWAQAHANRGVALTHLARHDEAESALLKAAELDAEEFVVHQGLGFLYLEQGKLEEAVKALDRSLELDPENAFTHGVRARAYHLLGRLADAAAAYETLAAMEPGRAFSMLARSRVLAELRDFDAALAAVDRAAAIDPGATSLALKADILARAGRAEEAEKARKAAAAKVDRMLKDLGDPHSPTLVAEKARLLSYGGDHAGALAALGAALRHYTGNTVLLRERCLARVRWGLELPQALKDCNEAMTNDPDDEQSRVARAILALRMQRWDLAIEDCEAALRSSPKNSHCIHARGLARKAKGEADAATKDLTLARRYDPDIGDAFERFGLRDDAAEAAGQ